MAEPTAEFFGINHAAERLGISPSGLRRWERAGWIPPAIRVAGSGRRLYRPSDIQAIRERVEAERAARQHGGPERAA